jgi:hypothetical protein
MDKNLGWETEGKEHKRYLRLVRRIILTLILLTWRKW